MALISCPECDKEISDSANACPNCGRPIEKYTKSETRKIKGMINLYEFIAIVFGLLGFISLVYPPLSIIFFLIMIVVFLKSNKYKKKLQQ